MSLWEMFRFISSSVGITFRLVPLCVLSTLLLGIVLGIVQFKRIPVLCRIIDIYVLAMRGIPPLVVMMLLFYSVNFSSSFLAAFVALTIYHAAYITEIVRGGLASVPKGQLQAGESLALGYWQIMLKIYIPQIMIQIVPSLCGQYILVVKDTTLVSVVGVQDIMWKSRQLMAVTFNTLEIYLMAGVIYYVLCLFIELIAHSVEKKVSYRLKERRT